MINTVYVSDESALIAIFLLVIFIGFILLLERRED